MSFKLRENKWKKLLCSLPESGMGYQIVDITLKSGKVVKRIKVFNAEIVKIPPSVKTFSEDDIINIKLSTK